MRKTLVAVVAAAAMFVGATATPALADHNGPYGGSYGPQYGGPPPGGPGYGGPGYGPQYGGPGYGPQYGA